MGEFQLGTEVDCFGEPLTWVGVKKTMDIPSFTNEDQGNDHIEDFQWVQLICCAP